MTWRLFQRSEKKYIVRFTVPPITGCIFELKQCSSFKLLHRSSVENPNGKEQMHEW